MAHHYKVRTFFLGDEGMDLAAIEDLFDTPPLAMTEEQRQTPLARLMFRASELMAEHLAQREVTYRQQFFHWDEDAFGKPATQPEADQAIDVVFYAEKALVQCYDVDDSPLGFHAVTDPLSETGYAEARRVFVHLDPERFLELAQDDREQQMDPGSERYDDDTLEAFLNTISHELIHAIEWVEHSNGEDLSTCEVAGLFSGEIFGGYGAIEEVTELFDNRPEDDGGEDDPYFQAIVTSGEWAEQRAEEQGREIAEAIWGDLVSEKVFREMRDWMSAELSARITSPLNP